MDCMDYTKRTYIGRIRWLGHGGKEVWFATKKKKGYIVAKCRIAKFTLHDDDGAEAFASSLPAVTPGFCTNIALSVALHLHYIPCTRMTSRREPRDRVFCTLTGIIIPVYNIGMKRLENGDQQRFLFSSV